MNRRCNFILWYTFLFVKIYKIYTTNLYGVKTNKYMTLKIMKLSVKMVEEVKEEKDHTCWL